MAKSIKTKLKLQIEACKANPAPPIGPALGQHGINIADFVPAEITIYEDRIFDFILKPPPASALLKKAAGVEKGAATPNTQKVGKVTKDDVRKIAERKMVDLNTNNIEAAMKIIEGTAKNMGIEVIG